MIAALESSKKRKSATVPPATPPAATTTKTKKPRSSAPPSHSLDMFFSKKQKTINNEAVPTADVVEESQPVAALPSQTSIVEDSQPMKSSQQQVVEDSQAVIVIEDSIAASAAVVTPTASMEVEDGDSNTRLSTMSSSSSSRPMRTSRQKTDEKMNAWLKGQNVKSAIVVPVVAEANKPAKKEFAEQDLHVLKEFIRANPTKTQKELVSEFKSNASGKMVSARIGTIARRAKWAPTDTQDTWRLVEDLTEAELAASVVVKKAKRTATAVEFTEEEKKIVDSAKDLLDICKSLLKEIFFSSSTSAKAEAVAECDFDQATPSPEVIQVISSVVTPSRMLTKEDLAVQVLSKLNSTVKQHTSKVVAWIDLVAKRVEYDKDVWAFEMENSRGKRNVWLKSLFTTKRDIGKFIVSKRITGKFEETFTKLEERVNKVKREWFVHNNNSATPPRTPAKQQQAAAASAGSVTKVNPLMRFFTAAAAPATAKEEEEEVVLVAAASPVVAETTVFKPNNNQRTAFLFVDSRVQVLHYDRSTQQEYFGINNCVTGRTPFKLNPNVDYDVDSEDEDGESLAENEQEEADDLDYTDRWLAADDDVPAAASAHMGDSSMRIVGVCLDDPSAFPSNKKPLVSIRNQPFEPRNEFPELVLTQYTVTVHRKRGLVIPEEGETKSPAKKPALRVVSQDLLPTFCQVVEGSTLKKDELVSELVQRFGEDAPSKLQITKKLAECAAKLGKRWVIKTSVLLEANVERNKDNFEEFQLWAKKKKITQGTVEEKAAKGEQELFTKQPATPKKGNEEVIIAPPSPTTAAAEEVVVVSQT